MMDVVRPEGSKNELLPRNIKRSFNYGQGQLQQLKLGVKFHKSLISTNIINWLTEYTVLTMQIHTELI